MSTEVIIRKHILFYHILLVNNYYVLASEELTALPRGETAYQMFLPHKSRVPYLWLQNSDSDSDSGSCPLREQGFMMTFATLR